MNEVKASRLEKDVVFVAVDGHKTGDYKPYLLRSDDRGPHLAVDRRATCRSADGCGRLSRIT